MASAAAVFDDDDIMCSRKGGPLIIACSSGDNVVLFSIARGVVVNKQVQTADIGGLEDLLSIFEMVRGT